MSSPTSGDPIQLLNQRFAIVCVGAKVVVMETRPDGSIKELWPFEEFRKLLIKETVTLNTGKFNGQGVAIVKELQLADVWLKHTHGRKFDRLVYAMPGSIEEPGPDDYNGWLGFKVAAKQGDWSKNHEFILNVVCNGDKRAYEWTINWIAALLQRPGQHAMTAIVLRGEPGIGKGHFAHKIVGTLFSSQQYIHISGASQLTGEFNEHLSGKCYVFADESAWGGDLKAADQLKSYVTESTMVINRKFLARVEEPSAMHIMIASNNEWAVHLDKGDRRYTILDVNPSHKKDIKYFDALNIELKAGGQSAFLYDMLSYPVDWDAVRIPFETEAKQDVMMRSATEIQRWWYEKLRTGVLLLPVSNNGNGHHPEGFKRWPGFAGTRELHEDYLRFLDSHDKRGRERRSTETEVGRFLAKQGARKRQVFQSVDDRPYRYEFNDLSSCRNQWVSNMNWPVDFDWNAE